MGNLSHVRRGLAAAAIALLLGSCSYSTGQEFTASNATQIRSGVTDKAGVIRSLGEPLRRQTGSGGDETWFYSYFSDNWSLTARSFIPFMNLTPTAGGKYSTVSEQVTIVFHGDIVASCKVEITTSDEKGAGTTQQTNCGDTASTTPPGTRP